MIILLMGVSGSGKTTIGQLLADSLHWEFSDADTFHSPENIEKMRRGIPLSDADRIPWLQDLQTAIAHWLQDDQNLVLACSALKASYREWLVVDSSIKLIYLNGSF
jgi:gluconokinase